MCCCGYAPTIRGLGGVPQVFWSERMRRARFAASAIVFPEVARLHVRGRIDLGMPPAA